MNRWNGILWKGLGVLVLAAIILVAYRPAAAEVIGGWRGEYFNNTTLSGAPVLVRVDRAIDFDWGGGSPQWGTVNADQFSVRWTGDIVETPGRYRFTTAADDGVRLWINGQLVIDRWLDQQTAFNDAVVDLPTGRAFIQVEYFENAGGARALLHYDLLTGGPGGTGQWLAEYYNNRNLTGTPALTRNEVEINFDWGAGSPAAGTIVTDNFSARFTRQVTLAAGRYQFAVTVDDGARLWVNNQLIIDQWRDQMPTTYRAEMDLAAGTYPFKLEYYDVAGGARVQLAWTAISGGGSGPWFGEYFNNRALSGTPAYTRSESDINFDWGNGSPVPGVIGNDNFSARWTRQLSLAAGRYQFTVTVDDGARLWVNNQLIVDQWRDQAATTYRGEINLSGGNVPLKLEYYDSTGGAKAQLSWTVLSGGGTTTGSWRAEYYNNTSLSGTPVLVRDEGQPDYNWGTGSPAPGVVGADYFSVRWTRSLDFQSGRYRFTATSDDGVRVWVNNQLIIDNWRDHASQAVSGEINLPGGAAAVRMEYYDSTAGAEARLRWERIGTAPGTGGPSSATVTSSRLNVRQGPSTTQSVLAVLLRGQTVQLAGYRNADASWVKVILADGRQGWSYAAFLQSSTPFSSLPVDPALGSQPPSTGATATVTAYRLNVRQGPGSGFGIITSVSRNAVLGLVGRNSAATWAKVSLSNGTQGWVNASYISTSTPLANLPVVN